MAVILNFLTSTFDEDVIPLVPLFDISIELMESFHRSLKKENMNRIVLCLIFVLIFLIPPSFFLKKR